MDNNTSSQKPKRLIQSVERAVQIIGLIAQSNNSCSLTVISQELSLNKSTVYGLISTLEAFQYVEQDSITGAYHLGIKLFELGQVYINHIDLRTIVHPYLNQLCERFGETAHLAILSDLEIVYMDKVNSPKSIGILSNIGGRNPSYCTGVGKVLLASLNETELAKVISHLSFHKFTPHTIDNPDDLIASLKKIQLQGYAMDLEEIEIGLSCVAAPIKDHTGKSIAAISISGPKARLSLSRIREILSELIRCSKEISTKLGYKIG